VAQELGIVALIKRRARTHQRGDAIERADATGSSPTRTSITAHKTQPAFRRSTPVPQNRDNPLKIKNPTEL